MYGIELESSYPGMTSQGECKYNVNEVLFTPSGYSDITASDNDAL